MICLLRFCDNTSRDTKPIILTKTSIIDLFELWPLIISIDLFSSDEEMNAIVRKSMPNLVIWLCFRAAGETHAKW